MKTNADQVERSLKLRVTMHQGEPQLAFRTRATGRLGGSLQRGERWLRFTPAAWLPFVCVALLGSGGFGMSGPIQAPTGVEQWNIFEAAKPGQFTFNAPHPGCFLRLIALGGATMQRELRTNSASSDQAPDSWGAWPKWGDQGNGTYRNPVLPSDYSDLDCIRVGSDYFAISSTMQFSPGMVVLHSGDLVNWRILGHVVSDTTQISPEMNWDRMSRYGRGVWAGAIRHNAGRFWVYFGTPDEGYFMSTATDPAGPWSPLHRMTNESGWDDCCPFWDDDGQGYFVGTHFKNAYKTYLYKLSADGRDLVMDSAVLINEGRNREANKLYKINGWYYHFFSEVAGGGRRVMMQRARSISGPYNEMKVLAPPQREAKEPNQGGLVQTLSGDWLFFTHHGTGSWEGRAASLLPVTWVDDWPIIGAVAPDGAGRMVWSGRKPVPNTPRVTPQSSDEFESAWLSPQWEWNHQPRADKWSLSERPGWLRLHAFKPLRSGGLLLAGNTLTQRSFRTTTNTVTIKMDVRGMASGQRAGLCHFARTHASLGVAQTNGVLRIEFQLNGIVIQGNALTNAVVWLQSNWGLDGRTSFSYSKDGTHFIAFGEPYQLDWGHYRGSRIGVYCFNDDGESGHVDLDWFHHDYDGAAAPYSSR